MWSFSEIIIPSKSPAIRERLESGEVVDRGDIIIKLALITTFRKKKPPDSPVAK